jgi:CDP-paratose 2-epimerase
MRILITGVCGFVGSQVALGLRRRMPDAAISGVDSLIRPGSQTTRPFLSRADIHVRHGDVRIVSDFETLGDFDWVIDAAANPSVLAGVDGRTSSRQLIEHNLLGTLNVLELCKQRGAGLLLLSTSRVYSIDTLARLPLTVVDEGFAPDQGVWPMGASPDGLTETFSTAAPISLYGSSKLASEALALEYGTGFDFPVVIDRCGVIAGPGQFGTAEQGVFSFWIGSWAARHPLTYLGFGGTGHQVRDALHPDDLAELVHAQLRRGMAASGVWNVGGGRPRAMSLAQVSRWCRARLGDHSIRSNPEPRKWDVPWVVIDSRRATNAFGWQPSHSLESMLTEIAAHYASHPEWLALSRLDD